MGRNVFIHVKIHFNNTSYNGLLNDEQPINRNCFFVILGRVYIYIKFLLLRFSAILLIAVFFFYSCGFHFYYQFRLQQIKTENIISIQDETRYHSLVAIHAPLDEIIWLDDHEISWNGNLYDITQVEVHDNFLTALGEYDAEEAELQEEYENAEQNNLPVQNTYKIKTTESFLHPYISFVQNTDADELIYPPLFGRIDSGHKNSFFPPPKA